MRVVNVTYHQEKEGWWAESIDAPSFFAAGATRDEVRQHARDALPRILGEPITEDQYREAELTIGRVLAPAHRQGEWARPEGVALSWIGAISAAPTCEAA